MRHTPGYARARADRGKCFQRALTLSCAPMLAGRAEATLQRGRTCVILRHGLPPPPRPGEGLGPGPRGLEPPAAPGPLGGSGPRAPRAPRVSGPCGPKAPPPKPRASPTRQFLDLARRRPPRKRAGGSGSFVEPVSLEFARIGANRSKTKQNWPATNRNGQTWREIIVLAKMYKK